MDIEGVFDCAPFQKFCYAGREHSVDETLIKWIYAMPTKRLLCAEVGVDHYLTTEMLKSCRQESVLSLLLCSMLINPALYELQNLPISVQVYPDDVAVLAVGRDLGMVRRNTKHAVDLIDSWCLKHGLSVNPNKAAMVLLTN